MSAFATSESHRIALKPSDPAKAGLKKNNAVIKTTGSFTLQLNYTVFLPLAKKQDTR